MASTSLISLTVTHKGALYPVSLLPDSTLASLQDRLEELTSVPPSLQKLLFKGRNSRTAHGDATLTEAGLKDGMKVQMLGSTTEELGGMNAAEKKWDRISRERASKAPMKVRVISVTFSTIA